MLLMEHSRVMIWSQSRTLAWVQLSQVASNVLLDAIVDAGAT